MKNISDYLIASFLLMIILFAASKRIDVFKSFVEGVKDGLRISIRIFPNVFALIVAVELFTKTGVLDILQKLLSPVLSFFGIYKEAFGLIVIKPFSGSSSFAVLRDIFEKYGVDSEIGIYSSIICASTETLFYVITTYLAATNVKKTKYLIPVAIAVDFLVLIIAAMVVRMSI
ncbi:nucleoside recognition domain protein [Caldicellulosiruptor acetigenus I77R1B]|uniref:Nucleoside recognition domain protein n=1 Tax=Caldicellulosiruptor acetigenus (strain ATCC 700853 / DSM 12137 / I77R1B) TaxID=632335 RepID=E4S615_CALA7|nr:nucleoside recognition domain-containing protein [Caldicellulosiruptor acetigenus]ADQ39688.1 nucleoside recognition domain protein [Caldicellulosiruptor acetigenus I77R1B]